ncbi:response regulator [Rhizobium sp. CRIBSB]|nr:response regulator [Rhizobium sp. CRIBSB]
MICTVLVVEDDEIVREVMDLTLSQAGYRVVTAGSGEDGLDMLRRMQIDLVLLDVHMPRMSGLDMLLAMKRLGRPVPPVIMVSANRSAETVRGAMELGCAAYVAKPFTPEGLLERVRKVLAGRAPVEDVVEI